MEVIQDNKTAPHSEGLSLWGYFVRCVTTKYSDFSGRARRKEWWGFILFQTLIFLILQIPVMMALDKDLTANPEIAQYMGQDLFDKEYVNSLLGGNVFFWVMMTAAILLLVPTWAVTCRRFHDVGISTGLFWFVVGLSLLSTIIGMLMVIAPGAIPMALIGLSSYISMTTTVILIIAFIPGIAGPNTYGPDPKHAPTCEGHGQIFNTLKDKGVIQDNNTAPQSEDLSHWGYFVRCITTKYSDFSGRARRKEWWGFILFQTLILIVPLMLFLQTSVVDLRSDPSVMQGWAKGSYNMGRIYYLLSHNPFICPVITLGLLLLVPMLAVTSRRFHDAGISHVLFLVVCELTILITVVNLLALIEPGTDVEVTIFNFIFLSLIRLVVLVVAFIPGKISPNGYGADPEPTPTCEGSGQE